MTSTVKMHRRRPLFLQTGFRTGGTWLWSRFRDQPGVLALCEPFNEALADITEEQISALTSHASGLNHPHLKAPYFHEYMGLLNGEKPGVRGFQSWYGIESYFGHAGDNDVSAYLRSLTDHAATQGKTPVLKFTRALGRAKWLHEQFPNAAQLLLLRHPLAQFWSGYLQSVQRNNFTFLMIPVFALSRANMAPARAIIKRYAIPCISPSLGVPVCAGGYTELARQMPIEDLFGIFLAHYVLSHALSAQHADLIVYQDRMQTEPVYREWVEQQVATCFGIPVDLSDIKTHATEELQTILQHPLAEKLLESYESVLVVLEPSYPESVNFVRNTLTSLRQDRYPPKGTIHCVAR